MNRNIALGFANFLAAFGGGTVLGAGVSVLKGTVYNNSSVLAFFVGAVIGIALLRWLPTKMAERLSDWLSILGGCSSVVLFAILGSGVVVTKDPWATVFFAVLTIRFAFWFYSRVLRAANVARSPNNISWVELGYYSGIILGLVVWKLLGVSISFAIILVIDAILQIIAGIIDIAVRSLRRLDEEKLDSKPSVPPQEQGPVPYGSMFAAAFITVGVQVIALSIGVAITHAMGNQKGPKLNWIVESVGVLTIACFYFGVAMAAFVTASLKLELTKSLSQNAGDSECSVGEGEV